MKSKKKIKTYLHDLNDKVAAVTKHRWEPHEFTSTDCHIWLTKYLQQTRQIVCVWQSGVLDDCPVSISFQTVSQSLLLYLLERVHKSVKLIDVFLINRQFLRKWVLQTQRNKVQKWQSFFYCLLWKGKKVLPGHRPLIGNWCPVWG